VKKEHDLFATDFVRCHNQAKASLDKLEEWKEVQAANDLAIRQMRSQADSEIREHHRYIDEFKETMTKTCLEANEKHLGLQEKVERHHLELLADGDKLRDINGEYKESKALIAQLQNRLEETDAKIIAFKTEEVYLSSKENYLKLYQELAR
jgi:hypothetical protein